MNWLLDTYNSGVVSDTISPDNITDGIGITAPIQNNQFANGFFVGLAVAVGIWLLIKLCKIIFTKAFNDDSTKSE